MSRGLTYSSFYFSIFVLGVQKSCDLSLIMINAKPTFFISTAREIKCPGIATALQPVAAPLGKWRKLLPIMIAGCPAGGFWDWWGSPAHFPAIGPFSIING